MEGPTCHTSLFRCWPYGALALLLPYGALAWSLPYGALALSSPYGALAWPLPYGALALLLPYHALRQNHGSGVEKAQAEAWENRVAMLKSLSRQLLCAVDFIHSADTVHGSLSSGCVFVNTSSGEYGSYSWMPSGLCSGLLRCRLNLALVGKEVLLIPVVCLQTSHFSNPMNTHGLTSSQWVQGR
eukprot:1143785-Pelagomonas_calceolata.AAC.2